MTLEEAQKLARFASTLESPIEARLNWLNYDFADFKWAKQNIEDIEPGSGLRTITVKPKHATPIDNGGPVHPYEFDETIEGPCGVGMPVRMWLAGQAMSGLLSNAEYNDSPNKDLASHSFDMADAVIAENKKGR